MHKYLYLGLPLLCLSLSGCLFSSGGSSDASAAIPMTPPGQNAMARDVIRIGDKITVQLTGVPDEGYLHEYQIPPTGEISVPFLPHPIHTADRTTADVAAEIAASYRSERIYSNPNVSVLSEERFVNIGGDVRGPSRVNYTADLTLMTTIISCGGFTDYADRRHVRVIRGQQVYYVDCIKAAKIPGADPPVYPGDKIFVPRTAF